MLHTVILVLCRLTEYSVYIQYVLHAYNEKEYNKKIGKHSLIRQWKNIKLTQTHISKAQTQKFLPVDRRQSVVCMDHPPQMGYIYHAVK